MCTNYINNCQKLVIWFYGEWKKHTHRVKEREREKIPSANIRSFFYLVNMEIINLVVVAVISSFTLSLSRARTFVWRQTTVCGSIFINTMRECVSVYVYVITFLIKANAKLTILCLSGRLTEYSRHKNGNILIYYLMQLQGPQRTITKLIRRQLLPMPFCLSVFGAVSFQQNYGKNKKEYECKHTHTHTMYYVESESIFGFRLPVKGEFE